MRVVPVLRSIELPLEFFDLFFPSSETARLRVLAVRRAHVCPGPYANAASPAAIGVRTEM
jgi:hypothetical protein